jgi:dimeric dUTPase (all-alpha-NTP-PPase superfamily)
VERSTVEEIFELQRQLNTFTLEKIGMNYEHTICHPEDKLVWIENYRKALSAELAELIREVEEHGIGTQNGKVEIVDMLHFLVSLSHIVLLQPSEIDFVFRFSSFGRTDQFISREDGFVDSQTTALDELTNTDRFVSCVMRTFLALDDLQNSLKWKWWAKGGGFKPDKAKQAVLELWQHFVDICALFGLDFPSLKSTYIAKNRVNFTRQNRHYNEDTKTEDDNRAIEIGS